MKSFQKISVFGALLLGALSTAAFAHDSMRVKVPFAFVVAAQQFAAGEYVISQDNAGVILVQGAGKGAMVISTPAGSATSSRATGLRFTSSPEQMNLTTVEQEGTAARAIPVHAVEQRTVTMSSR